MDNRLLVVLLLLPFFAYADPNQGWNGVGNSMLAIIIGDLTTIIYFLALAAGAPVSNGRVSKALYTLLLFVLSSVIIACFYIVIRHIFFGELHFTVSDVYFHTSAQGAVMHWLLAIGVMVIISRTLIKTFKALLKENTTGTDR